MPPKDNEKNEDDVRDISKSGHAHKRMKVSKPTLLQGKKNVGGIEAYFAERTTPEINHQ